MFIRFEAVAAAVLFAAIPLNGLGTTVIVNGQPDVAGVSYQKLSTAVDYITASGVAPRVINITTDAIPVADSEVVINVPMTIEGDADGNGVKCDILVDIASILGSTKGLADKSYLEVQASTGTVTINNLKIHPNADVATASVDGIRAYRPANAGEVGNYVFNNVWVSGSNSSDQYVSLETSADLYGMAGVKRWSIDPGTGANTGQAVIQLTKVGNGVYNAELNNCHAGLGKQSAMNIPAEGGTVIVKGGLYGHSNRDGVRVSGTSVTLTGSRTNRLRVVRVPYSSGRDAHGVEIEAAKMDKIEYVDVSCITSGNSFKFSGTGGFTTVMQYCRALGKLDAGANATFYATGTSRVDNIRNCTFVGGGNNYNPLETASAYTGSIKFYDCIFASENLGYIRADNSYTTDPRVLTNCAIPTDAFAAESLNATTPVQNTVTGQSANLPQMTSTVTVSPHFAKLRADYDWTEAAVSIDGSNSSAGNQQVLLPTNTAYRNAASNGADLSGGAGGNLDGSSSVRDWSSFQ